MRFSPLYRVARVRIAFAAALAFCGAARLDASVLTFTFQSTVDGTLTYIDNPAVTNPAHDSFAATITSPQLGAGTLSVPNDFTTYAGSFPVSSHANVGTFSFASGTFSGSVDAVIHNDGTASLTYSITSGTGALLGATGTILETATFTHFGSYPSDPSRASVTGGGTLTTTPEPASLLLVSAGLLACLRKRKRIRDL